MPVGRHVLDLHGESADTHAPSDALCTSLQVLNHLQDCAKDLESLDRCYLPADLMARCDAGWDDVRARSTTPGLRRVFDLLLDRTDALNRTARDLPRRVRDRRLRLETAVIVGLAHRLVAAAAHWRPAGIPGEAHKAGRGPKRGCRAAVPSVTALGAAPADLKAVETIVRAAGTSFYRGMRVLRPDRRHAMYAIYAFCRLVDDIADAESPYSERAEALDRWRRRVDALYRGEADDAVTRVLLRAVRAFDLRRDDFHAVIDGMEMDAQAAIVAPDLRTLDLYCDRVASAVGRLSVRAFGDASPQADRVAFNLGRALQLTNILRDVGEDAERGRLYLPAEYLDDAGVPHDARAALDAPGLGPVCARVAELAHGYFRDARAAMLSCDRRAMKPARLMGATYAALLDRIERRGWDRIGERASLPRWRKLWIALRYGLA